MAIDAVMAKVNEIDDPENGLENPDCLVILDDLLKVRHDEGGEKHPFV